MSFEINFKKILNSRGIKQTDLLLEILKECGEKNPYEKINTEKSNFNNMIKGKRPFKFEYALAIERILELRFYDLYKDGYMPRFYENKGIRYAAAIDKIEEYEKLLNEVEDVFEKTDEFGKTIFDYICEYNSKNGMKFSIENLKMKYKSNDLSIMVNNNVKHVYGNSILNLVKMICQNGESDYFLKLFPADYDLGYSYLYGYVYDSDSFNDNVLSSKEIIEALLKLNEVSLKELNRNRQEYKDERYLVYHPVLLKVFDYALKNSKKYAEQIEFIIDNGLRLNEQIISNLRRKHNYKYSIDEYEIRNGYDIYGYILNVDLSKFEIENEELKRKIDELNAGAKNVEIKPSSKDIDFDKCLTLNEFMDMIYKNTNINNYYSSSTIVFLEIKRLASEVNCKIDKLGDSLLEYLKKKKESIDITNLNNEYEYQSVSYAIAFTELYKDKLNNIEKEV